MEKLIPITKLPLRSYECDIDVVDEDNAIVLENYENDLLELINYKEDIIKMVKYYNDSVDNTNAVEVSKLDINRLPSKLQKDIITKSIKSYKPIYKLLDEICKEYPNYKKQDLVSIAFLEFYEKYKK